MATVPGSPAASAAVAPQDHAARDSLAVTALAALGVVYGDIGTSPLYALKECFAPEHGVAPTAANVLGVLSLVFWSLKFVVSFKYLSFIMRADNRGEGGILALLALLHPRPAAGRRAPAAGDARPVRRGAALRRRGDHPGHLGARRGRRARRGHARARRAGWSRSSRASSSWRCSWSSGAARRGWARVFGRVMVVWFIGHRRSWASTASCGTPRCSPRVNPWHAVELLPPRRPAAAS